MQRLRIFKIFVLAVILLTANFSYPYLPAGEPSVEVTLKNGKVEKFEYNSFTFDWTLPIRIKSQESCEEFEINKDDLDEVYIINEFFNSCDEKDDWEVDVYLVDKRQILGFFKVSGYTVKGRLYDTAVEKTIAFKDIKKVSFRRLES